MASAFPLIPVVATARDRSGPTANPIVQFCARAYRSNNRHCKPVHEAAALTFFLFKRTS